MNSLHSLLASDGILLDPKSLEDVDYLVSKIRQRDSYEALRWCDFANDEKLSLLCDRNTGRRYNFIEYFMEMVRGSVNFSYFSGMTGHNWVFDYFLILIEAQDAGFFNISDFINAKDTDINTAIYLFLLNDGVSPSARGFITLKRRIGAILEAIIKLKKTMLGEDFKIIDEFRDIRESSPMKSNKTESQIMVRALKDSKLRQEFGEDFTPSSYIYFVSIMLYRNFSLSKKEKKILKISEDVITACGITKRIYKIRWQEAAVFFVMNKGNVRFGDILSCLEKLFCVKEGGVKRMWHCIREHPESKQFRKELLLKYNKETAKFATLEICERVMSELGIKPKIKTTKENKMRGE